MIWVVVSLCHNLLKIGGVFHQNVTDFHITISFLFDVIYTLDLLSSRWQMTFLTTTWLNLRNNSVLCHRHEGAPLILITAFSLLLDLQKREKDTAVLGLQLSDSYLLKIALLSTFVLVTANTSRDILNWRNWRLIKINA